MVLIWYWCMYERQCKYQNWSILYIYIILSEIFHYDNFPEHRANRVNEIQEQCAESSAGDHSVYPKKYAHGFCFTVLCCGYTLTDFPISIRLTSLALWQSDDCPSASKATLMNMDKYFIWIHYERLHNHNKAKHNKTVCIFLGIYCKMMGRICRQSLIVEAWCGRIIIRSLQTEFCFNKNIKLD